MQATLIGVDEHGVRRRYHLTEFPVTLGRNEDADVPLPDPWVSGAHCKIDLVDGTLIVEDTFSRNGTRVNGCYVRRSPLMPGDELAVGISAFQVAYERCSVNAPPQACYTSAPEGRLRVKRDEVTRRSEPRLVSEARPIRAPSSFPTRSRKDSP